MVSFGAYEARTQFSQLLDRVEKGESISITRSGKEIARLVPVESSTDIVREAIEAMRRFECPALGSDLTIRELIEEGRE